MTLQLSRPLLSGRAPATGADPVVLDDMPCLYDPFPIGCARNVFAPEVYRELMAAWPATELFQFKPELGKKYSLSEVNNPDKYHAFISSSPVWMNFYQWAKSARFVDLVVGALCDQQIDTGLRGTPVVTENHFSPWARRTWAGLRRRARAWAGHRGVLRTRFEFSMLPADGGYLKPHTDAVTKLITLVFSMVDEGEWNPTWGGATATLRPRDITRNFNWLNQMREFNEYDTLHDFPFVPNQCVVFVKTFNSHHAVYPMTAPGSAVMRRTITVNIERVVA